MPSPLSPRLLYFNQRLSSLPLKPTKWDLTAGQRKVLHMRHARLMLSVWRSSGPARISYLREALAPYDVNIVPYHDYISIVYGSHELTVPMRGKW